MRGLLRSSLSGLLIAALAAAKQAAQAFLPEFVRMVSDKDRYDQGAMAIEGMVQNGYVGQEQAAGLLYNAARGLAPGDRGYVDSVIRRIKNLDPDKIGAGDQMWLPLGSR